MKPTPTFAGLIVVWIAIGTSLLLGTFGWFAVGFGMMTDCTDNYSCSQTGCAPCATTGRWITVDALTQWVLRTGSWRWCERLAWSGAGTWQSAVSRYWQCPGRCSP